MGNPFAALTARIEAAEARVRKGLRGARRRWRWFDHLARAYERYEETAGDRQAAALTYYAFLSFFPLTALAFALVGYVVAWAPDARQNVTEAINDYLPGLTGQLHLQDIARAREGAGLIGLTLLLWGGLGLIDALRQALHAIWRVDLAAAGNIIIRKIWDLVVLITLGVTLFVSVAVSSFATGATHTVLRWVGLDDVTGAALTLRVVSILFALGTDMIIFFVLLSRLSGTRAPWHRLVRGALFGAAGLEVLKLGGTYVIGHTLRNPVYASFAVTIGLLVWMNLTSRLIVFTAAWTATRRIVLAADGGSTPAGPGGEPPETPGDRPADEHTPPHTSQSSPARGAAGLATLAALLWLARRRGG